MKISHSAKETYLECGYKYFLHYMLKLRSQDEKSPLIFGDAIDTGLNSMLSVRNLEIGKRDFLLKWNEAKKKTVKFSKSDYEEHLVPNIKGTNEEKAWESLKEKGIIILEEYFEQIMPKIKKVEEVQLNKFIPNGHGDALNIKTDFICTWEDGRRILFDNKTSSVKYDDNAVKESKQLATYYEMLKEDYKIDACGYIVIPKKINKKKLPRIEIKVIIDNIPEETIASTFKEYDQVLHNVKTAQFPKNEQSCFSKYGKCTYYDYCHKNDKTGLSEKD